MFISCAWIFFCCGQIVGRMSFKNPWNQFAKPQIAEVHFLRLDFCGGHYVAKKNEEQQKMIPATAHTTYRPWWQHSTLSVVKCGLVEDQCPSIRVSWSQPAKSTARTSIATRHTKSASHRCCGTKHQIVYLNNSLKRHCVAKKCKPKKWFLQQYVRCKCHGRNTQPSQL